MFNTYNNNKMTNFITLTELKNNYPNLNFIEVHCGKDMGWVCADINNFNPSKTSKVFGDTCISFKGFDRNGNPIIPIVALSLVKARVKLFDRQTLNNKTYKIKF